MDVGDGCITLETNIVPLNCTLKNVKIVNFMFCVFYHDKKQGENTRDLTDWLTFVLVVLMKFRSRLEQSYMNKI